MNKNILRFVAFFAVGNLCIAQNNQELAFTYINHVTSEAGNLTIEGVANSERVKVVLPRNSIRLINDCRQMAELNLLVASMTAQSRVALTIRGSFTGGKNGQAYLFSNVVQCRQDVTYANPG